MRRPWKTCGRGFLTLAVAALLAPVFTGCGPEGSVQGLLSAWSPDGKRLVVAPESADSAGESGLWLWETETGYGRRIVSLPAGWSYLHPQWSPASDEILFAAVPEDGDEDMSPYSVWKVRPDGTGLEMIAESTIAGEGEGDGEKPHPFLQPNAVMWGALPGTVVFQAASGGQVMAMLFDPYTGDLRPFLPEPAQAFSLQPSPCRRLVVAVAYRGEGTARVLISDFGFGNWRTLADLQIEAEHLRRVSPVVFWSPDSSRFAVPEMDGTGHYVRVFDVRKGRSRRVARAFVAGRILWDEGAASVLFSGGSAKDDAALTGIFRAHVDSQAVRPVVLGGDPVLLSTNPATNTLLFSNRVHAEGALAHLFFSCSIAGYGLTSLPVESVEDGDPAASVSPDGGTLVLISGPARVRFLQLP